MGENFDATGLRLQVGVHSAESCSELLLFTFIGVWEGLVAMDDPEEMPFSSATVFRAADPRALLTGVNFVERIFVVGADLNVACSLGHALC
jgi:hypothetical protein